MQSPYIPLSEIIDLFKQQGFTEKDLNLNSKTGMIEQTLKRAHVDITKTVSDNSILEKIVLEVPGRFDKQQDLVAFKFDLYFNPETDKFRIRALTAIMDGTKKLYLFADTRMLVRSKEVYDDLVGIRNKKVFDLNRNIICKPTIQNSMHL